MMLGMVAASSAVIFVKLGTIDPVILAAYRLLLSSIILFPLFIRDLRRNSEPFHIKQILPSVLPGIILALHFIFWIRGARLIPGAHASLITTMSLVFMPFLMAIMIREHLTKSELTGTALAITGSIYLGLKDSRYSIEYLTGDFYCFISMILVTLYLAFARLYRKSSRLWFYMVPLYFTGGLVCLAAGMAYGAELKPSGNGDWYSIAGLALICTVAGHSINNFGMRKLRGQVVSLLNLTQILYSTLLSFLIFGEVPPGYFYPAALLILTGPLIVILVSRPGSAPRSS